MTIKRYQKRFVRCIKKSLEAFKNTHITIQLNHVDDASNWRNYYDYDPLEKLQGYSLFDITMKPLIKVPEKDHARIHLALTSEMGTSLKLYSKSYSQILKMLPKKMNIGASINYNQSFGSFLDKGLKLEVLNEFDFIGVSAYDKIEPKCSADNFKKNIEKFRKKLKRYGLTKPENDWKIQITEIGIGGGASDSKKTMRMPYKGIYGPYSIEKDPWQKPSYSQVRKDFYHCLLDFLKTTNLVNAAFIWNANSWDVQGFYPFSKHYKNPEITQLIKSYNNATHSM